jgi:RNA polymerase sigma-70 factor, ECF subfamily
MTVSENFTSLTGRFRGELLAHCYRMLGPAEEAEDLVQETYLRAWRSFGRFEGGPAQDSQTRLVTAPEVPWLQPFPDALLTGERGDPAAVAVSRTGIRLAFVAALQHLSARERAVLILRDVLEFPAAEAADLLDTTTTAVNSGLRRARAQLAEANPAEDEVAEPTDPVQRALLDRFAAAFENADASALAGLLREDVALEMPPLLTWFSGRQTVARFIGSRVFAQLGGFQMVPVAANGQPAFAGYTRGDDGSYHAHEIVVPTVTKTGITRIVVFLYPELFAMFGLPHASAAAGRGPA